MATFMHDERNIEDTQTFYIYAFVGFVAYCLILLTVIAVALSICSFSGLSFLSMIYGNSDHGFIVSTLTGFGAWIVIALLYLIYDGVIIRTKYKDEKVKFTDD